MDGLVISVFYEIDSFCKVFIPYMEQQCIQAGGSPVFLEPPSRLALSGAIGVFCLCNEPDYYLKLKNLKKRY